jgi:hypothetical protein
MSCAPAVGDEAATAAPAVAASAASSTETPVRAAPGNAARQVAARSATHPALLFLLVTALVALAVFVLLTLDR